MKLVKNQKDQQEKQDQQEDMQSQMYPEDINKKIIEILKFFSKIYSDIFISNLNKNQNQMNKLPPYSHSIHSYCTKKRKEIDSGREIEGLNTLKEFSKGKKVTSNVTDKKIEYEKAVEILNYLNFKIRIEPCENYENKENNEDIENKLKFIEIKYGENKEKTLVDVEELKLQEDYEIITEEDKKYTNAEIVYKNYKKLAIFINDIQDYIKTSRIQFNPQIEFELEKEERDVNEEENSHHDTKDLYYITCKTTFINQINNNEKLSFKDENILVYSINGRSQGFINLINELNNEDYIDAKFVY